MRPCRACGYEHPSMMACSVAKRLRESAKRNEIPAASVTKSELRNENSKRGRPTLGVVAMTNAERQKRHRDLKRVAK